MLHRRHPGAGRGAGVLRPDERRVPVQRGAHGPPGVRYAPPGAWVQGESRGKEGVEGAGKEDEGEEERTVEESGGW